MIQLSPAIQVLCHCSNLPSLESARTVTIMPFSHSQGVKKEICPVHYRGIQGKIICFICFRSMCLVEFMSK